MAEQKTATNLPLQNEMGLVSYMQEMLTGKKVNPAYTGATVRSPELAKLMEGSDLQNLMTEYLRGQGGFLDKMRQQNLSGLYNTSTQKMMANDLTAQAALKASTANTDIATSNARMMNDYYKATALQQPKYVQSPTGGAGNVLGALGIAGLNHLLKSGGSGSGILGSIFGGSDSGSDKGKSKKTPGIMSEEGAYGGGERSGGGVADVAGFLGGGLVGNLLGETADSFGTGFAGGGIDFGSFSEGGNFDMDVNFENAGGMLESLGSALGGFDFSDFELPDFDLSSFELPDFDLDFDFGSWFS